jgi:predicted Zn-dependent peptidase
MHLLRRAWPCLLLVLLAPAPGAAEKPQIDVEEMTLANGMRFLLFERHETPTVAAGWVARVGSANERPGITGLSHFFEHMMFKGTRVLGTRDLARDLELIAEQERLREQMRRELSAMRARLRRGEVDDLLKPENKTARYRELEKAFDEAVLKQREIIVKDQLDQVYTRNGGEFLNAFTNEDMTGYFVRVPANRLELWAWLESDRLANPVFREFYSERDVVFEERRLRTESTPLGKYDEAFAATFWEAHPYGWPVVGWASDIPSYTKEQADAYFATYYAPNNLTGILVGDFRKAEVKPLLERYFGRLPRGQVEPPEVVTLEPPQIGEKRYLAEAETSPTVRVWWKGVPFVHKDAAALDLLTDILSGRTGRLYKGLVLGRQVANEASAAVDLKKYAGSVQAEVTVKDGKDPAEAERALFEEIERLKNEPVPAAELQKVKNQAKANAFRRLSSPVFIMFQLIQYEGLGDWTYINTYADGVDRVSAEDLQRAARDYLRKETRTVGVFLRKEGGPPEDPEVLALPAEAQAMAQQALKQIGAETDLAKLRESIARMQQMAGQAPPPLQPALALVLKRAQERLSALEGKK